MKRSPVNKTLTGLPGFMTAVAILIFTPMPSNAQNGPASCGLRTDPIAPLEKKLVISGMT